MTRPRKKRARPRAGAWRTCAACRQPVARKRALRLIRDPQGLLRPDFSNKLPGRGLHLCPSRQCLLKAGKRQLPARGYPAPTRWPDGQELLEAWVQDLRHRAQALLALCHGSGWLVAGRDAVSACLKQGRAALLLLASDAGKNLAQGLRAVNQGGKVPLSQVLDSQRLSTPLPWRRVSALAVTHRGLADKLRLVLEKLAMLEGQNPSSGLTDDRTRVNMPGRRRQSGNR